MSSQYVVVTVNHTPGGKTAYGLAITTNGIDRQPVGSQTWDTPRPAHRAADKLQRRIDAGVRS